MRILFLWSLIAAAQTPDGFVLIRGGAFQHGRSAARVDDFEMAPAPVTNAEYKLFLDATAHPAPLHWQDGRIPPGMETMPVIFVNRFDVAAYTDWRSKKEGRVYRLPTASEFIYAAKAGRADATYPWGNDAPAGKANYDPNGDRTFAEWRTHLKPVKNSAPNPWGLYDMAGNVWQMIDTHPDYETSRYKYRIESAASQEGAVAGGSWARAQYYLQIGITSGVSAGIRHPDLGFRLVREPAGVTHFRIQPRRLIAAPRGNHTVFLSWQFLPRDGVDTAFHVYRSTRRDAAGDRITAEPVRDATNFTDRQASQQDRIYYRVRPATASGEGSPSEWAAVEPAEAPSCLIARFEPTSRKGGAVPVFGDLDGDGRLDAILKVDNGIKEMSRDPGVPVELEAFTSYGRSLWRRPQIRHDQCYGNSNNAPMVVWDLDGDGRSEVIARIGEGDETYLAILDGMSGRTLRKTPWTTMVSDFSKSSTRIHLSVAYLDGRSPFLITQTGLYENEVIDAFDVELKKIWTYQSFAETNGSGSHHIDIADLDGDGKDEVVIGSTALNGDGKMRWSIYREHPDIVAIKSILPGRPGRQVFYAVETSTHAGAYLVDAGSGKIIWKVNREDDPRWTHAHTGWVADIYEGAPGMEMLTNRDGHNIKDLVLFAANGRILMNENPGAFWWPVNWSGGKVRDLISPDGRKLARFDGKAVVPSPAAAPVGPQDPGCGRPMSVDFAGDYRDEIVCTATAKDGGAIVLVYSNLEPVAKREITRTASREYRLWMARNLGGGYGSYFEWEP